MHGKDSGVLHGNGLVSSSPRQGRGTQLRQAASVVASSCSPVQVQDPVATQEGDGAAMAAMEPRWMLSGRKCYCFHCRPSTASGVAARPVAARRPHRVAVACSAG